MAFGRFIMYFPFAVNRVVFFFYLYMIRK